MNQIIALLLLIIGAAFANSGLKGQNRIREGEESYRLLIKFRAEVCVDVEKGKVRAYGKVPPASMPDLEELMPSGSFEQLVHFTDNERSAIRTGIRPPAPQKGFDKFRFSGLVEYVQAQNKTPEELLALAEKLEQYDNIEYCELVPMSPPPPPSTPDFTDQQYYKEYDHGNDTIGINMEYAWSIGIKGKGVRIADIEWNWDALHEDLIGQVVVARDPGSSIDPDHGTAVAGVMVAKDNGFGVTGMVHEADAFYGFSERVSTRTEGILHGLDSLRAGDVFVYEMQDWGKENKYVPADISQSVWDVTKAATDAGIIVVAAAGNGNSDLDDPYYDSYHARGDNGSIIVGAGTINGRRKASFSTYGSRIDVQGWGDWCVMTTGYGDEAGYNFGPHREYRSDFSGTSSATPIVASAVVAIQSYAKSRMAKTLTPVEMRDLLKRTGTPGQNGTGTASWGTNIPVQPDIKAALLRLDTANISLNQQVIFDGPIKDTLIQEDSLVELNLDTSVTTYTIERVGTQTITQIDSVNNSIVFNTIYDTTYTNMVYDTLSTTQRTLLYDEPTGMCDVLDEWTGASYSTGDIVMYNGGAYIATSAATNADTPGSAWMWKLLGDCDDCSSINDWQPGGTSGFVAVRYNDTIWASTSWTSGIPGNDALWKYVGPCTGEVQDVITTRADTLHYRDTSTFQTVDSVVDTQLDTVVTTTTFEVVKDSAVEKRDTLTNGVVTATDTNFLEVIIDTTEIALTRDTLVYNSVTPTIPQATTNKPVLIYPNPALRNHSIIRIGLPQEDNLYRLRIFDAVGNVLFDREGFCRESEITLSAEKFFSGKYLVVIESESYTGRATVRRGMLGIQK